MRIALVILHADPARGGAERYTIDLAAALAKAGHDVSLLATTFSQVPAGVTMVKLDASGVTRTSRYRRMLDSLERHLEETNYDIVHAMLPVRRCDVYHPHAGLAVEAIQEKRLQSIFNPRRNVFATVERELLGGANPPIVIALSAYVKRSIEKHYPLPSERLAVLFNAVDLDKFQILEGRPLHRQPNKALIVAQDFARKGVSEVISAMAMLADLPLELVVVGGDNKVPYAARAVSLGLAHRVLFVGAVTDSVQFYRDSDFLVLPTKHDPCSLVVLEALAMGMPVISTRFNGACEIMTNGVHGFILDDPTDIDSLAQAMRKLMDPKTRLEMIGSCMELRPRLAYEHHLSNLLSIYQRAIANRQAKS